jgi:hypothetical protein
VHRIATNQWQGADLPIQAGAFSATVIRVMWLIGLLLMGAYFIFAHGCHADADTDLIGDLVEVAGRLDSIV